MDLLAVQGTLNSFLQHHSSKASILQCSAFFIVQLSHPYMTTGKTIALTRRTFFGKVKSLLYNVVSRLVITFLPRSKCLHKGYSEAYIAPWSWSCLNTRETNLSPCRLVDNGHWLLWGKWEKESKRTSFRKAGAIQPKASLWQKRLS